MSTSYVIKAAFADWRTVKSRKVLQLVFEIPLEQQAEVLTVLGAPMPDTETWCGIARLNPGASSQSPTGQPEREVALGGPAPSQPAGDTVVPALTARQEQGKARYAAASDMEKALIRAARLPKDERFQKWASKMTGWECDENDAVAYIRDVCCEGGSRKMIAYNQQCYAAFVQMETAFLVDVGQMAEPR